MNTYRVKYTVRAFCYEVVVEAKDWADAAKVAEKEARAHHYSDDNDYWCSATAYAIELL